MNIGRVARAFAILSCVGKLVGLIPAESSASIAIDAGYFANFLTRGDDNSSAPISIGFSIDFYGDTYTELFINSNGSVTFNSPRPSALPVSFPSTSTPILSPFLSDVDTSNLNSGRVSYGTGTFSGRSSFGVSWGELAIGGPGVGYFPSQTNLKNDFQLVIVDRSDVGVGDFDFYFNYHQVQWDVQGKYYDPFFGTGIGPSVGWSNGAGSFDVHPASGLSNYFLDGYSNALISTSNYGNPGTYRWQVRNGNEPPMVPEAPAIVHWLVFGLLGICPLSRLKNWCKA